MSWGDACVLLKENSGNIDGALQHCAVIAQLELGLCFGVRKWLYTYVTQLRSE